MTRWVPSKWVVGALGWGSSCGNILCHYRRIRRGEENYIWRKIRRVPQSTLQNPADVWERSDGHPICAELDTSNKCDRVFPSTPLPSPVGRCVTEPRQRRTNMASIREAVNTSRAAHYSYSVTVEVVLVTSWRQNCCMICIKDVHETGKADSGGVSHPPTTLSSE